MRKDELYVSILLSFILFETTTIIACYARAACCVLRVACCVLCVVCCVCCVLLQGAVATLVMCERDGIRIVGTVL
jgi:hypothetical protein